MSVPTLFQLSYFLLWILALVLIPISVVLLYLLAQLQARSGHVLRDESKLIGRKMPALSVQEPSSGAVHRIDEFRGYVVLSLSPDCGSYLRLIEKFKSKSREDFTQVPLMLLCVGEIARCQTVIADIRCVTPLALDSREFEKAGLLLRGFPAALVVDDAGVVSDVLHPQTFEGVLKAIENARKGAGTITGQQDRFVALDGMSSS